MRWLEAVLLICCILINVAASWLVRQNDMLRERLKYYTDKEEAERKDRLEFQRRVDAIDWSKAPVVELVENEKLGLDD